MRSVLAAVLACLMPSAQVLGAPGRESLAPGDILLEAVENLGTFADPAQEPVTFSLKSSAAQGGWEMLQDAGGDFLKAVARWQIQIFDFDDRKVDFIQGLGRPPADRLAWSGIARDGNPLKDGFYRARLVWADGNGTIRGSPDVRVSLLFPPGVRELLGPQVRLVYSQDGVAIRIEEALTFAPGDWELRSQALPALDEIARFLDAYPDNRLVVQGHADSTGGAQRNRLISLHRAQRIYQYLLERGIDPARVTYEGRGDGSPVADNATAEGRMKNRRVEIVLLKSAA